MEPYREATPKSPNIRASDNERDAVVQRLQTAFAEGRLTDEEFDDRMRTALAARTHADLDVLLTDLPTATTPLAPRPTGPVAAPAPGRYAIAYKNSVSRAGRWRVPATFRALIYKGSGVIDLRAADLTAPVTSIRALAYKSDIDIIVPPGVRVEVNGFGVSCEELWGDDLPADAPVVDVRGAAYKGLIATRAMPRR